MGSGGELAIRSRVVQEAIEEKKRELAAVESEEEKRFFCVCESVSVCCPTSAAVSGKN